MAIVGNSAVFAIEWNITRKCSDGKEYANFCFWVNGLQLGDFQDEIIISSTVKYLANFLNHYSVRSIEFLSGRSKETIFSHIYDGVMFTTSQNQRLHEALMDAKPEKTIKEDWIYHSQLRDIFHLDDVGGAAFLDKYNIILFNENCLKLQRIIWRNLKDMSLHEFTLSEHYFDDVAKIFLNKSQNQHGIVK